MEIKYIEATTKSGLRWNLSFIESNNQIPFDIKRVYYIYDLFDDWMQRWNHAHHNTKQVLFCINWKVKIWFDTWNEIQEFILGKANKWVYISLMVWHYMTDFSPWCILLVIASEVYNENNYIREYASFRKLIK